MNRGLRLFTFNEAFAWQHLTTALCEQFEPAPPQAAARHRLAAVVSSAVIARMIGLNDRSDDR
jgi:hypothetical protein